jgi:hypothetical protein
MGQIESKPSSLPRLLSIYTLFDWFTFEFIQRPTSPILSPLSRTFVELTLVSARPTPPFFGYCSNMCH